MQAFSLVVESRAYSLVGVDGFLIAVASLVAEHRLQGAWASAVAAHARQSPGSVVVVLRHSWAFQVAQW